MEAANAGQGPGPGNAGTAAQDAHFSTLTNLANLIHGGSEAAEEQPGPATDNIAFNGTQGE